MQDQNRIIVYFMVSLSLAIAILVRNCIDKTQLIVPPRLLSNHCLIARSQYIYRSEIRGMKACVCMELAHLEIEPGSPAQESDILITKPCHLQFTIEISVITSIIHRYCQGMKLEFLAISSKHGH